MLATDLQQIHEGRVCFGETHVAWYGTRKVTHDKRAHSVRRSGQQVALKQTSRALVINLAQGTGNGLYA